MPLVLQRSKAMFLHIPKTGGTWVRFALQQALVPWQDYGYQHATYEESAELFPASPRFTTVRNPFTWYASYWADRVIEGMGGDWILGHECNSMHFPTFVRMATMRRPGFLTELYATYAVPGVKILRCESLRQDLRDYLKELDEPYENNKLVATPQVNRGACLPFFAKQVGYTRDMERMVLNSEHALFSRYDYSRTAPFRVEEE